MNRHNLGTVIGFEFRRTVFKPRFWLISLSVPVLIAVVVGLIALSGQTTAERAENQGSEPVTFTYTDASGLVDPAIAKAAGGTEVTDAAAARQAVVDGTSQCHIDFPKDPLSQSVEVRGTDLGLFDSGRYSAVAQAVLSASVEKRIGDPVVAKLAVNGADISLVTYADGRPTPGLAGVIAPGLFLVLFYLAVLMLGNQMLNVTLEEKENRVTEMILTTMNPTTLIVGKVIALALIGIVQGVAVGLPAGIVFGLFSGSLGLPSASDEAGAAAVLGLIPIDPATMLVGFALFLLSFLMFTGLLVAIGAVMPSAKEAGNAFGVVVMSMFVPLYAASLLVSDPHGVVSQVFTFFPLTAPVSALLRNATGGLSWWEAGIALVVLGAFGWAFLVLGVRLFRTGSISYGSRVRIGRALGIGRR
ncbi:ABC transporter permease [Micropruina sonneratiae]|uniref:ABC transporter permease n=1 Tax=Micropruina sonneratiae TaxID=2986940 RepID=UPI002225E56E|nr:ABC transporter permease [Micropruina sp. KQZ13P-5]MCW3159310.1 ABC transporter permease [Micropruina sp. KQZ13P-5]